MITRIVAMAFYLQRFVRASWRKGLQRFAYLPMLLPMSAINNQGVRAWRHWPFVLVFMACLLCVGGGGGAALGVRISEADVSRTDVAVVSHAVKEESVKMQGPLMPGVRPRAGRHPLVKLGSYKRNPDQLMLEEGVYKEAG